ncbi:ATP-binding protein [Streptomyces sp. NPDC058471]|uniref:sensor histidine kinase n=1 Tax=Streptomyces sp. NPDC058471 TaxID=3346516 RepID=UPI00364E9FD8
MAETSIRGHARRRPQKADRRVAAPRALRRRLHWIAILPALVTLPMMLAALYLTRGPASHLSYGWVIWVAVTSACAVASAAAWSMSTATAAALQRQAAAGAHQIQGLQQRVSSDALWAAQLREGLSQALKDIQTCMDQMRRGERPQIRAVPDADPGDHPLPQLACAWDEFVHEVQVMITGSAADQDRAALLVLGRRMLTLANQTISECDALERSTEDPEVLRGLFALDHKVTRKRRFADSLIILGGGAPREPSEPSAASLVLQHAIQEVEGYRRVEMITPVDALIRGRVTVALAHLLAELIDNGLNFSPPEQQVKVRLAQAPAGVTVEIEDRGSPAIPPDTLKHLNQLLAEPTSRHISEYARDGRTGIWVVSKLANRYGLRVHLEANVYGATTAVVVVPLHLLADGDELPTDGRVFSPAPAIRQPALSSAAADTTGETPAESTLVLPVVQAPAETAATAAHADPPAPLPRRRVPQHGIPRPADSSQAPAPTASARAPLPARDPAQSYRHPQLRDQQQRPAASRRSAPDPGVLRAFTQGTDRAIHHQPAALDTASRPTSPTDSKDEHDPRRS